MSWTSLAKIICSIIIINFTDSLNLTPFLILIISLWIYLSASQTLSLLSSTLLLLSSPLLLSSSSFCYFHLPISFSLLFSSHVSTFLHFSPLLNSITLPSGHTPISLESSVDRERIFAPPVGDTKYIVEITCNKIMREQICIEVTNSYFWIVTTTVQVFFIITRW